MRLNFSPIPTFVPAAPVGLVSGQKGAIMRLFLAAILALASFGCSAHPDRETFAARVLAMDKDSDGKPLPPCEPPIAKECVVK